MPKKSESTNDIPLIPLSDFKEKLKEVLNVSKTESDQQLEEFQTSNAAQRAESSQRKRGRKPQEKN